MQVAVRVGARGQRGEKKRASVVDAAPPPTLPPTAALLPCCPSSHLSLSRPALFSRRDPF